MNVLVGKSAPEIYLEGVDGKGNFIQLSLSEKLKKYEGVVLFFYPLDFTFVCPTELIQLHEMFDQFHKRGILLLGINTDSKYSHAAWRKTDVTKGGIGDIGYVLLSDYKKEVSKSYGILFEEKGVAFRATFFIDSKGIVRHQSVNDLPIGRNIDEIVRIIDAWKFHEKNGEVCPVNWKKGDRGMEATEEGLEDYIASNHGLKSHE